MREALPGLGLRILAARQRAGLTQAEIARAVGITRTAITKIENGDRRVTALELARIATAVGERVEWFFTDAPEPIVSHRNLANPGEPSPQIDRTVDRVVRAVEFVAENATSLQQLLQAGQWPTPDPDRFRPEELAVSARAVLGLNREEPLHSISGLLAKVGLLTFVVSLGRESADAASVLLRDGAVAVINGDLRTGRRRLALVHEFGHVLLADEYSTDWRIDGDSRGREARLDQFARALLLPKTALVKQWPANGDDRTQLRTAAVRIASEYRVDMSTLARRLDDLKLADAKTIGFMRSIRTTRADIVNYNLVVADELKPGELPRPYEKAVIGLYENAVISEARALDLLMDTWEADDLPELPIEPVNDLWDFVS